jgi:hypothetical protein
VLSCSAVCFVQVLCASVYGSGYGSGSVVVLSALYKCSVPLYMVVVL